MKANKGVSNEKIKIIPLGGLEHIGMNITCIEYEDSIIVIDCGLSFPDEDMLGIDLVIPDVTYLKDNIEKVKGFVITHGHEDHIGALPYVLQSVNAPVYATKLTMGIIEHKLKEHNMMKTTKRKVVRHGQSINLGCFRIEFIKTNHSIADAAALAIYTPAGIIVHTGDFKIDYTPVFGEMIDLIRFAELGKKGVLALLCESTNAERPGFTQSERTVEMWLLVGGRGGARRSVAFLTTTRKAVSLLQLSHPMWTVYSRLSMQPMNMVVRLSLRAAVW